MAVKAPLRIFVTDPRFMAIEDFKDKMDVLQKQGHEIEVGTGEELKYDLIVGPNCWYTNPDLLGLFTMAVEQARKVVNADTERVKQSAKPKATKGKHGAKRKAGTGSVKAKKSAQPTGQPSEKPDDAGDDGVTFWGTQA